jgi:hypothetical protein
MKLSKDELKQKIVEKITDEDTQIELLEDIEDSMDIVDNSEVEALKVENEDLKTKYDDIKTKYKNRFLGTEKKETEEKIDEPKEEEKVEEVDIFKDTDEEE